MTLSKHRLWFHDGLLTAASGLATGLGMAALDGTALTGYVGAFAVGAAAFLIASDFPHKKDRT